MQNTLYNGTDFIPFSIPKFLVEIDRTCNERMEIIVSDMAKQEGSTCDGAKALLAEKKELPVYHVKRHKALAEYAELKTQAADIAPVELYEARQAVRPAQEKAAEDRH